MRVNFPRSYVDVNREPYELDPRMFHGRLPSFANTRSMRVAGGLGTIPRVVGDGQDIYSDRLSVEDALAGSKRSTSRTIARCAACSAAHQRFGAAVLIDCHSMPSVGVSREEPRRPDIVIGDRYGTSCVAAAARHHRADHDAARLFGRPQQTLCRRLHHRALRQSGQRIACNPARTQSRDLHGRAAARTRAAISRRSPKISPALADALAESRSATSARSRPPPNKDSSHPHHADSIAQSGAQRSKRARCARKTSAKKKGPLE